jgi:NAD(P)-dependent dehydrogenase (short-subunit alcohol dehydrogenase family)
MHEELAGKVALVVGASRGVGRAYALGLAAADVQVAAVDRCVTAGDDDRGSLEEVIEAGRGKGPTILGLGADLSRKEDIRRAVDETLARFGRIDIFLYNAVAHGNFDVLSVPDEHWDLSLQVNLRAPYAFLQLVVPQMKARGSGSIILMSSRASLPVPLDDLAHTGRLAYGVTKAALNRMATFFAEELKPYDIAVNVLSPGVVKALSGGGEPTPEQFAPPVLFLAGQTARTYTGQWCNTTDFGTAWP